MESDKIYFSAPMHALFQVIGKDLIAWIVDVKLPQFHGKERKVSYRGSNSALVLLCWMEFSLKFTDSMSYT